MAIVGGGPAGMSAAIYACENGKKVVLFEKNALGGQMLLTPLIENYPGAPGVSGPGLALRMESQLRTCDCEIRMEKVTEIHRTMQGGFSLLSPSGETLAKEVVYAAGAIPKKLGLPGEEEFRGKGVSYCAVCDGQFFRGKDVAVVGGGNSAMEEALQLSLTARTVYLIHRSKNLHGNLNLQRRVANTPNLLLVSDWEISSLHGDRVLSSLTLKSLDTQEERSLSVNGLFVAIGRFPENRLLSHLLPVDENGYFRTSENCETSIPGLFVAGDCRAKTFRQVVTATADGAAAALSSFYERILSV